MAEAYVPIACGFHDRLEAWATERRCCTVVYRDEAGGEARAHGRIVDVFARGGAEFLRLSGGELIRLDRLVRVEPGVGS